MVKSRLNTNALSLSFETLRELTPDEAAGVNGGSKVSSALPPGHGFAQPTATAVSSARPPVHHKKHHHHQTVSSVRPI